MVPVTRHRVPQRGKGAAWHMPSDICPQKTTPCGSRKLSRAFVCGVIWLQGRANLARHLDRLPVW